MKYNFISLSDILLIKILLSSLNVYHSFLTSAGDLQLDNSQKCKVCAQNISCLQGTHLMKMWSRIWLIFERNVDIFLRSFLPAYIRKAGRQKVTYKSKSIIWIQLNLWPWPLSYSKIRFFGAPDLGFGSSSSSGFRVGFRILKKAWEPSFGGSILTDFSWSA